MLTLPPALPLKSFRLTAEQNRLGMRLFELDKAGDCLGGVAPSSARRFPVPLAVRRAPCAGPGAIMICLTVSQGVTVCRVPVFGCSTSTMYASVYSLATQAVTGTVLRLLVGP